MIRVPWVAVVGGGMDTSTMAIGGRDSEVFTGRGSTCWCRITRVSLIRATRTAPCVAADGPGPPVLAVSHHAQAGCPGRSQPRRGCGWSGRVRPRWCCCPSSHGGREAASPLNEASDLLTRSPIGLPRPLREYAAAIGRLAAAITASPRTYRAQRSGTDPAPRITAPSA
jgi:hypothetical protein